LPSALFSYSNNENSDNDIIVIQESEKSMIISIGYDISPVQAIIYEFSNLDATLAPTGIKRWTKSVHSAPYLLLFNINYLKR